MSDCIELKELIPDDGAREEFIARVNMSYWKLQNERKAENPDILQVSLPVKFPDVFPEPEDEDYSTGYLMHILHFKPMFSR